MEHAEHVDLKRKELIGVAIAMLAGELNLIEGVRRICGLRFAVDDPDNAVFLIVRGIESQTDAFPIGAMRSNCNQEYLQKMDAEMDSYLADAATDILQACNEIISTFTVSDL